MHQFHIQSSFEFISCEIKTQPSMLLVQPVQYTDSNSHRSTVLTVALSTTTVNTSYHRPRGSETISPPPLVWNGMTCQVMLWRPRRCRCSRTGWRHTCSTTATKLVDFINIPFLVIISTQNSGPCNSYYCLDHSKNVYDDDDDDDWQFDWRHIYISLWTGSQSAYG